MTMNSQQALMHPLKDEAKYEAFSSLPFKYICLGMKTVSDSTRYIKIELDEEKPSLLSMFKAETKSTINIALDKWESLIPQAIFEKGCSTKQGFNYKGKSNNIRLGITSGEEGCVNAWTDSWIGVGAEQLSWCDMGAVITAGNQCCSASCSTRKQKPIIATAYIYVQ